MDRFVKASEFGYRMGIAAVKTAALGDYKGALIGAGLGAGGTALHDYLTGVEENKLMRALLGAGAGGTAGAAYDAIAGMKGEDKGNKAKEAPAPTDVPRFPSLGGLDAGAPGFLAGGALGGGGAYAAGKALKGRAGAVAKLLSLPAGLFGGFLGAKGTRALAE